MAEAAAHHEQMEDLMAAESWMQLVEDWQFQGIDHTADRINDPTGKQPEKLLRSKGLIELGKSEDAGPPHSNIKDRRYPFRAIDPAQFQDTAKKSNAPDSSQQDLSDHAGQYEQTDRCITAGNQYEDHHMIDLLSNAVGSWCGIKGMIARTSGI